MELQQIHYFLALARTLNFTRAAEECNVSQPALTRAIQALEAELGGELLRRERHNSHLTDLGNRMLPLMQRCHDSALSAKNLALSVKTREISPLSIAISHSISMDLLRGPLGELSRAYPGVQLRVKRGSGPEISELLKDGEAELAVAGPLGEEWNRLDTWPMLAEPFERLVSREHRLAENSDVEPEQLEGEQFLVWVGCEMGEELSRQLSAKRSAKTIVHEVDTDQDLIALVEANLGIAIIPASGPQSAGLRHLPVRGLDLRRTVAIYGVAGRERSPGAVMLLNMIRAADWSRYAH